MQRPAVYKYKEEEEEEKKQNKKSCSRQAQSIPIKTRKVLQEK